MSYRCIAFKDCNLNDPFFDSLKEDYPEFTEWFKKKATQDAIAYIDFDDNGQINAFLSIKPDLEIDEPLGDNVQLLPAKRMKISTLKIDESSQRLRFGEGAIGIALWTWQKSDADQIYLTTFPKQKKLIYVLEKFGFEHVADTERGELIYLRDKKNKDYSDPRKSFPFVNPEYPKAKYLPILDRFHDIMFQRSELKGIMKTDYHLPVSNGITKIFIATPYNCNTFDYSIGDLVFIYRIHDGPFKQYHSAVTSYCTVSKITSIKKDGESVVTFDKYVKMVGNKSVYPENVIREEYEKKNVYLVELIYNGYFGESKNIPLIKLKEMNLWPDCHPYESLITKENVEKIFSMGDIDVQNFDIY